MRMQCPVITWHIDGGAPFARGRHASRKATRAADTRMHPILFSQAVAAPGDACVGCRGRAVEVRAARWSGAHHPPLLLPCTLAPGERRSYKCFRSHTQT